MNSLWIVVLSVLTIYLVYNFYAKRIDRNIIQPDAKRATPARMYMDGVAADSAQPGETAQPTAGSRRANMAGSVRSR